MTLLESLVLLFASTSRCIFPKRVRFLAIQKRRKFYRLLKGRKGAALRSRERKEEVIRSKKVDRIWQERIVSRGPFRR